MKYLILVLFSCFLMACQAVPATQQAGDHSDLPAKKKQVVMIVHGAWGGGWAFQGVDDLLTSDGYKVYRPTLTGQGERVHLASPEVGLDTHVQDIVNVILFEDLHDIVLVGHSYGGMVITGVAQRVPDRIRKIVYVDAFLPEDGESANAIARLQGRKGPVAVNGFYPPTWVKPGTPLPHDMPMSARTFSDPVQVRNPEAAKLPAAYIVNIPVGKKLADAPFYLNYQRAEARHWPVYTLHSDHNMHISHPKEFVSMLEGIMRGD